MYMIIDDEQCNKLGTDHYSQPRYFIQVTICTRKFMRDRLRHIFENRQSHNPFISVWRASDNTIYEGLKIIGWVTTEEKERVDFSQMELGTRSIDIDDIKEVGVYH
jgi:hypothetical protein